MLAFVFLGVSRGQVEVRWPSEYASICLSVDSSQFLQACLASLHPARDQTWYTKAHTEE